MDTLGWRGGGGIKKVYQKLIFFLFSTSYFLKVALFWRDSDILCAVAYIMILKYSVQWRIKGF